MYYKVSIHSHSPTKTFACADSQIIAPVEGLAHSLYWAAIDHGLPNGLARGRMTVLRPGTWEPVTEVTEMTDWVGRVTVEHVDEASLRDLLAYACPVIGAELLDLEPYRGAVRSPRYPQTTAVIHGRGYMCDPRIAAAHATRRQLTGQMWSAAERLGIENLDKFVLDRRNIVIRDPATGQPLPGGRVERDWFGYANFYPLRDVDKPTLEQLLNEAGTVGLGRHTDGLGHFRVERIYDAAL